MNSNRIVIIDQDAAFIQTVSGYFSSIGIEVVSSGDGIEGYRMAKEVTPITTKKRILGLSALIEPL